MTLRSVWTPDPRRSLGPYITLEAAGGLNNGRNNHRVVVVAHNDAGTATC